MVSNISLTIALTMIILLTCSNVVDSASSNIYDGTALAYGPIVHKDDWVIEGKEFVRSSRVVVNGDIIIKKGGNLTVVDSLIIINCSKEVHSIIIDGFIKLINTTIVKSSDACGYAILARGGSSVLLIDSNITELGPGVPPERMPEPWEIIVVGPEVKPGFVASDSKEVIIVNTVIKGMNGLVLNARNVVINNSKIDISATDALVLGDVGRALVTNSIINAPAPTPTELHYGILIGEHDDVVTIDNVTIGKAGIGISIFQSSAETKGNVYILNTEILYTEIGVRILSFSPKSIINLNNVSIRNCDLGAKIEDARNVIVNNLNVTKCDNGVLVSRSEGILISNSVAKCYELKWDFKIMNSRRITFQNVTMMFIDISDSSKLRLINLNAIKGFEIISEVDLTNVTDVLIANSSLMYLKLHEVSNAFLERIDIIGEEFDEWSTSGGLSILYSSNIYIADSNISNNVEEYAIDISKSEGVIMERLVIKSNFIGIVIEDSHNITISLSDIFNNKGPGLWVIGNVTFNASKNWWGSPKGPEILRGGYKDYCKLDPDDPEEICIKKLTINFTQSQYKPWLVNPVRVPKPKYTPTLTTTITSTPKTSKTVTSKTTIKTSIKTKTISTVTKAVKTTLTRTETKTTTRTQTPKITTHTTKPITETVIKKTLSKPTPTKIETSTITETKVGAQPPLGFLSLSKELIIVLVLILIVIIIAGIKAKRR